MRRLIATLALLGVLGLGGNADAQSAITHAFHCTQPGSSDPSVIDCPKWNAAHVIDPTALGAAIHLVVSAGDPNGVVSGAIGDLARDTTGQLWVNTTGGTAWVAFVRADGNIPLTENAWAFLGDSNSLDMGTTTDSGVRWNNLVSGGSAVPDTRATLNTIYSAASTEPLTLVDQGTTDLQVHNVSSFPGFAEEQSFGKKMFDLLNGVGATPTTRNKPLLTVFGISGVELKQLLPGSTYGQATPGFGGLNAYNAWKTRTQTLLAIGGRKLGGVTITLGSNDGSNGTDAAAVAVNMNTLATQIRADFGPQVAIVWVKMHVSSNTPNTATVRAQMVTGIATIPGSKLIVIDTYPINGDLLHFKADPIWDMGYQALEAMRRLRGIPARVVTTPTIVGYGTPDYNASGGTTISPRGYPLSIAGDEELCAVGAMKNSGSAVTIPTPAGWTALGNTSQAIGGQTQEIALFRRDLTQADLDANDGLPPPVTITPGNDEFYAFRVTVRGANAFPTVDGSVISYAATSFTTSGVNAIGPTTTAANDLVLTFMMAQGGGSSPTEHMTASNAATSPIIVADAPLGIVTSNFGLLGVAAGTKVAAGAVGTTVITPSINANPSGFTVAFKN